MSLKYRIVHNLFPYFFFSKGSKNTEKAMAPHSSTLAWKIPWTEEPGGLQSTGSWRVGHDWATSLSLFTFMHWRRKWQPTPVILPGESQGRGSLVGWSMGSHRVGHDWSDLAAAAAAKDISKPYNFVRFQFTGYNTFISLPGILFLSLLVSHGLCVLHFQSPTWYLALNVFVSWMIWHITLWEGQVASIWEARAEENSVVRTIMGGIRLERWSLTGRGCILTVFREHLSEVQATGAGTERRTKG